MRALFVSAGNPVLSVPNGAELEGALDSLELSVGIDLYLNETTGRCDYVLPATTMYERDDFPLPFQVLQPTPFRQATEAVVAPAGQARPEVGHHRRAHPAVGTPHAGPARSRPDPESVGRLRFPAHSRAIADAVIRLDGRRPVRAAPGRPELSAVDPRAPARRGAGVQPARRRAAQRGGVPRGQGAPGARRYRGRHSGADPTGRPGGLPVAADRHAGASLGELVDAQRPAVDARRPAAERADARRRRRGPADQRRRPGQGALPVRRDRGFR